MIEALFILLMLQFSNYMPNLLGDKPTQGRLNMYITGNIYILNMVLLFIIYFTVKGLDNPEYNIYIKIQNTIIIWLIYLVFIKLNNKFSVITFILFCLLYLLNEYKLHHINTNNNYLDDNIDKIILANKIIIGIVMLVGLIINPPKIKKLEDILKP